MIKSKFTFLAIVSLITLSLNSCRELDDEVSMNEDKKEYQTNKTEQSLELNMLKIDSINATTTSAESDTSKIKYPVSDLRISNKIK